MTIRNKIFIVEDEVVVANDIKQILYLKGFNVVGFATKYDQAKTKILELIPDIVLCDIHLRDRKTGIDLMKELSERISFKIIFISAYSDIETVKKSNLVNPFNYLIKPFNNQQLITSVRLALISLNSEIADVPFPTKRELTIINLISKGFNSKEIGDRLFISKNTVDTHRRNLLKKYKAQSTAELISMFISKDWIQYNG